MKELIKVIVAVVAVCCIPAFFFLEPENFFKKSEKVRFQLHDEVVVKLPYFYRKKCTSIGKINGYRRSKGEVVYEVFLNSDLNHTACPWKFEVLQKNIIKKAFKQSNK